MAIDLSPAATSPRTSAPPDAAHLERLLRSRVDGEVRFDDAGRAAYSTDASNVRQVPSTGADGTAVRAGTGDGQGVPGAGLAVF